MPRRSRGLRRTNRRVKRNTMRRRNTNRKVRRNTNRKVRRNTMRRRNSRRNFRRMRGGGKSLTLRVTPCDKMLTALQKRGVTEIGGLVLYPLPHMCLVDSGSRLGVMKFSDGKQVFGFNSLEDGTVSKLLAHLHSADSDAKLTEDFVKEGANGTVVEEGGKSAMERMNEENYQEDIFNSGGANILGQLLNVGDNPGDPTRGGPNNPRRFLFGANGAPGGMWEKLPEESAVKRKLKTIVAENSAMAKLPDDFPHGSFESVKGGFRWYTNKAGIPKVKNTNYQHEDGNPKDPSDITTGGVSIYGGMIIECTQDDATEKILEMDGEADFFIPGDGIFSYEDGNVECPTPEVEIIPVTILGKPEKLVRVTMTHCDGSQKHPYVHKHSDGSDPFTDEEYYDHKQHLSLFFTTSKNEYTWDCGSNVLTKINGEEGTPRTVARPRLLRSTKLDVSKLEEESPAMV